MGILRGVIFDKDGTLFDFAATWSEWTRGLLNELSEGSKAKADELGRIVGFDLHTGRFAPDSVIIAHTPTEIAETLLPHLYGLDLEALVERMNAVSSETQQVAAVPLFPLFDRLSRQGLRIGMATSDAEAAARTHLAGAGIDRFFDFVAGFDSGHGAKPTPGQLLAFTRAFALDPREVAMVGDSLHDLMAGRSAGMRTVAVLTGIAAESELAPHADVVLPDIGHLPDWIAAQHPARA